MMPHSPRSASAAEPHVQIVKYGRRSTVRFADDDRPLLKCARCKRRLPERSFGFMINLKRQVVYCTAKCLRCQKQLRLEHASHPLMTPETQTFLTKLGAGARGGARARGILYLLTTEDLMRIWIEQGGRCALTGMPLSLEHGGIGRMRSTQRASIDRKSSLGNYTPDNVHLVCLAVNIMKNDLTMEEFGFWCQRVVLHALKLEDPA